MAQLTAKYMRDMLRSLGDAAIAEHSARFFKTGKGEYGEGDRFLGIRVPVIRKQVRIFRDAPLRSVVALLRSKFHEERLLAVLLLVDKYRRGDAAQKQRIFDLYLEHRAQVNNWDLVDSSAHLIVGPQLESGDRVLLYELAESDDLWDRRIAMMATYHYIRNDEFADALRLAAKLRDDEQDLIHKAVGWMLREIGNRDQAAEERFLERHYRRMPRTMLRYAIEKFPETRRRAYLDGTV
ncbi:MAG: DNA alkylation repair protein [Woeseiaceae bacterium]|nr:DNA alkylation repair protein [Woeseiaceae bacterium]